MVLLLRLMPPPLPAVAPPDERDKTADGTGAAEGRAAVHGDTGLANAPVTVSKPLLTLVVPVNA